MSSDDEKETSNFEILREEVLSLSESEYWSIAKEEWYLCEIYEKKNGTCVCTHHPITDHCVIINRYNHHELTVGNRCIKHFPPTLQESIAGLFTNFKRLKQNQNTTKARVSQKLRDYCYEREIINEWERDFLFNTHHKKSLTFKQSHKMIQIHNKIICKIGNRLDKRRRRRRRSSIRKQNR